MHRLIGNVRPQKLSDPPSDKLFVSDPLHRLKHQRMMGEDQIRTLQKCLVYRIVINIDRDENLLYFLICPAENQAAVIPAHGICLRRGLFQQASDFFYFHLVSPFNDIWRPPSPGSPFPLSAP